MLDINIITDILYISITINGASEYRFNGKVTTYEKYNKELEKQNILVKAKNFLVFQVIISYYNQNFFKKEYHGEFIYFFFFFLIILVYKRVMLKLLLLNLQEI